MIKVPTLVFVAVVAVGVGACSDDDGEAVRDCRPASGPASGSEAGSGSEPASGTASGSEAGSGSESECPSGSGSASGSAEAICDPFGNAADADTTVTVTLTEFSVTPDVARVGAGLVHFAIENAGSEAHEFLVVQADAVQDLPVDEVGALDEAALVEDALIGEVPAFPAGETCDGTFALGAGEYVLLCNRTAEVDGEPTPHLVEGMATAFTVE